jgi:glycosyltransferase involved in cell wall biosynthesis
VQGEDRRRTAVKRAVERVVYRRAVRVVVLSHAFKRLLVERYGVAPWRVEVVPPGVDLTAFRPGDRGEARQGLGLPAGGRVVLAVRRLVPRMGLDVLIDAWARLVPDASDVLVVVGQGRERQNLEDLATRLGVAGTVRFMGRVGEATLLQCYHAADLVVVPSVALEGFGLIVLEALACGAPVIATSTGGLPEVLAPLDPGLIVDPGDAGGLAARITAAFDGSSPLPARDRCRRHAESFTWQRAGRAHRAIYADAVRARQAPFRVVYLDHCALLSGGELALARLLPALGEVDAHVVLAQEGPLVDKLLQSGISVEVFPMAETARGLHRDRAWAGPRSAVSAARAVGYTCRLAWRLRRLRPDLVHTNSLKSALYGGVAGRLAGVPVVWHVRDRIAEDYLPPPAVRLVRRLARRLPSAIIGNSRATLATIGATRAAQAVVPSPVVLGSSIEAGMAARRRRDSAGGGLRIGMIGRLAPWKGQHIFLEGFAAAFPEGNAHAVVVGAALFGESAYEEELRRQATRLGLDGRVEFRGFRADIGSELAGLDVVVHASVTPEPFGQVVVEAMGMGLPVVAAAAGGPAEIVEDGVTGMLFPPADVDGLRRRLERLSSDPDLRERLGAAARERARDFSPHVVAPMVMAVYHDVLADETGSRN